MSEIHGRLLIGGMTLKDLHGVVELCNDCPTAEWCGHLLVDPSQNEHLEVGRLYRLEMDDGRSGQIVISSVEYPAGQRKLRVLFNGVSPLKESAAIAAEARSQRAFT
jgi:hypothetical protein